MKKYIISMVVMVLTISFSFASIDYSNEQIEVKIFQISFEQSVNQNFDDLLLRKTNGFLKYQWEPEGLYIVMEKSTTENEVYEVLKQINFTSAFKISGFKNRILPIKALKN